MAAVLPVLFGCRSLFSKLIRMTGVYLNDSVVYIIQCRIYKYISSLLLAPENQEWLRQRYNTHLHKAIIEMNSVIKPQPTFNC